MWFREEYEICDFETSQNKFEFRVKTINKINESKFVQMKESIQLIEE